MLTIQVIRGGKTQRTSGPVNAHLISGSFRQFGHCLKMGQGQLSVIMYINSVELESILLHAKFHDHTTISSVGEDLKVFTIMSMAAILVK